MRVLALLRERTSLMEVFTAWYYAYHSLALRSVSFCGNKIYYLVCCLVYLIILVHILERYRAVLGTVC